MTTTLKDTVLIIATIAAGLLAGLFYGWTVSVMPGLARADDRTWVESMRGVNVAILNGWFMLTFLGAPLLVAVAGFLYLRSGVPLWWIIAAFGCLVAMLVITGAVHMPMNNAIDAGGDDYAALRARFEGPWVHWNLVRTAVSIAGFGCLLGAVLSRR